MRCNKDKSMMLFMPWQKSGRKPHQKGSVRKIKIVESAKYLGIEIDRDLQYNV